MASLPWVRLDCSIDTHPDMMGVGPWGLIVFQTLIRIVKERGENGTLDRRFATPEYLARRSLFESSDLDRNTIASDLHTDRLDHDCDHLDRDPDQGVESRDRVSDRLDHDRDRGTIEVRSRYDRGLIEARSPLQNFVIGLDRLDRRGLIEFNETEVCIPGWSRYQRDRTGNERQKRFRGSEDRDLPRNAAPRDTRYVTPTGQDRTGQEDSRSLRRSGIGFSEPDSAEFALTPEPIADEPGRVDWDAVSAAWLELSAESPKMRGIRLTDRKKQAIRARAKDEGKPVLDAWLAMLAEVRRSTFLRSGFTPAFTTTWATGPVNWGKIMSGDYDDSGAQQHASPAHKPLAPKPKPQRRADPAAVSALFKRLGSGGGSPVDASAADRQRALLASAVGGSGPAMRADDAQDAPKSTEGG